MAGHNVGAMTAGERLPRETIRRLGMRKRVELQEEPDHIGVWPDESFETKEPL